MTDPRAIKPRYEHFIQRVHERIGEHVDAPALYESLRHAIEINADTVDFIARLNNKERRIWRFHIGGQAFFTVYDHTDGCPITVLTKDLITYRDGNVPLFLEDYV